MSSGDLLLDSFESLSTIFMCSLPFCIQMFFSAHYTGPDLVPKFRGGEYWKKVFGPVFMYLNSSWVFTDPHVLWEDAKIQVLSKFFSYIEFQ